MGRVRLPNPEELDVIKTFLGQSTFLHIDGVEFWRHSSSGMRMRVDYRDVRGHSHKKQIVAPDEDDFENVVVMMSELLGHGVTKQMDAVRHSNVLVH